MSLRKKQTMTLEKISANRANGSRTHGPATPEGRERIRAANTRHGLYSQAETAALVCLGEDPAELESLRNNLHGDSQASAALRQELAEHLVEVVWRWKRAGRSQEGFALRLAKEANLTREDRVHAHMMRLKMTEETLRLLARSVEREHYVTTPADLEMMKNLHQEGVVKEMGEIALALFYQLQAPGTGADGVDPNERSRRALLRIKEIFGLASDTPPTPKVAFDRGQPQNCRQGAGTPGGDVAPDSSHTRAGKMPALHHHARRVLALPKRTERRIPAGKRLALAEWITISGTPASPRRNGRRGSGRATFWKTSSTGRWRFAKRNAWPS